MHTVPGRFDASIGVSARLGPYSSRMPSHRLYRFPGPARSFALGICEAAQAPIAATMRAASLPDIPAGD